MKNFIKMLIAFQFVFFLFACANPTTTTDNTPDVFFQSKLLSINSSGHFLSDISYTNSSTGSFTPPLSSQTFSNVYRTWTLKADGTYEYVYYALEGAGQDWDKDGTNAEGWVMVYGERGTYTYNRTTYVMSVTYTSYYMTDPSNTSAALEWRPIAGLTTQTISGTSQWYSFYSENLQASLFKPTTTANEFKRVNTTAFLSGRNRTEDIYYSVNFSGSAPVVTYTQERSSTTTDGVTLDTSSGQTYKYVRVYSGGVGGSPTPTPTSLSADGNYVFVYTAYTDTYYDWDTGTGTYSTTPRSGYPTTTTSAGTMGCNIVGGNYLDYYASAARSVK